MSTFFKEGSILDEYSLTKEKFETVVGLGAPKAEVLKMFSWSLSPSDYGKGATYAMLDKWCREHYNGMPFNTVFELLQMATVKKFEDLMLELGARGNPTAISIANEVIRGATNNSVVQINFNNNLPLEDEEDKEDEDE